MPSITDLVRAEGFLYLNPTNLTSPDGYGTELGYTVSGVDVYTNSEIVTRDNEENGNNVWKKFYLGNRSKILSMLRSYNSSVISVAGQGHNTGSKISYSGSRSIGAEITTDTDSLIFIPKNAIYPCVYVKNASVQLYSGMPVSLGHAQFTVWPIEIDCLAGGSTNYLQIGLKGDISL